MVILSAGQFFFSLLLALPQFRCATPMDAHLDKSDLPCFLRLPLQPIFHASYKENASKAICCSPGPPAWIPHWWAWHSQPCNNPARACISNLLSSPAQSTCQAHRAFSSLSSMICIPPGHNSWCLSPSPWKPQWDPPNLIPHLHLPGGFIAKLALPVWNVKLCFCVRAKMLKHVLNITFCSY